MPELVELRREGSACVLVLNRPEKLNAISAAVERELLDALTSEEARSSRCIVLSGAGPAVTDRGHRKMARSRTQGGDKTGELKYFSRMCR